MNRLGIAAALLVLAATDASAGTLRLEGRVLGAPAVIEVAGEGQPVEAAMRAAYDALTAVETMVEGADGAVARLNARAGEGPGPTEPELVALLARALSFCRWSDGVHGPLGGWLYRQWGLREPVAALPSQQDLDRAISLAACDGIEIGEDGESVELRTHAVVDTWGFDRGWAVDRAVDALVANGIDNATVRLGGVQRGLGGGPQGAGWEVLIPLGADLAVISDGVRLVDTAIAIVSSATGGLRVSGQTFPPFIDQRSGRPPQGVVATAATTELAVDAEALTATMYVTGSRRGSYLAGQLRPTPSVLWLMGTGSGKPLVTDYRWSYNRMPGRGQP